jgi:hypothetical protein
VTWPALVAAADRAALKHLGGSTVRYTPAPETGQAPVDVQGLFEASFVRVDAGHAGAVSAGPAVFLRLEDLPTDPEEDEPTVTVGEVEYRVREPQKDGQGGVVLFLHRM